MDRKKLIRKLEDFKKKLEKKIDIKEVILFGSRVNGRLRKNSDVDLIIVGDFKGKGNLERAPQLYDFWEIDLPVDFICYTPEEYELLKKRISIVKEALTTGIFIK